MIKNEKLIKTMKTIKNNEKLIKNNKKTDKKQ
jgi:hypothetical protein